MVSTTLEPAGRVTDSLWRSFIVDKRSYVALHLSPCMAQPSDLAPTPIPAPSGTKSATSARRRASDTNRTHPRRFAVADGREIRVGHLRDGRQLLALLGPGLFGRQHPAPPFPTQCRTAFSAGGDVPPLSKSLACDARNQRQRCYRGEPSRLHYRKGRPRRGARSADRPPTTKSVALLNSF